MTARRVLIAIAWVWWAAAGANAQQALELVERTLAIVGGRAVTLSDVRAATALGLIDGTLDLDLATETLVERMLVLREVERYAPPEPQRQELDLRWGAMQKRFSDEELASILKASGFTEARLRAWIRDDLRIAAYLTQRFAAAADGPADQTAPEVREKLSNERRERLIADWIADLRRRTQVVELWRR